MDLLQSSQIGDMLKAYTNQDFALIAFLTFFLCEAIFSAFPVEQARMKQLTSIITGAVVGLLFARGNLADGLIRGILAGGATTISVAKFKKPSAVAVVADLPADAAATALVMAAAPLLPEPVEHL